MITQFGQPMLPKSIMHTLEELRAPTPEYDPENGGQWVTDDKEVERISFQGAVLPVSEEDIKKAPQGTYTKDSRKVYTNGHDLQIGSQVYDPKDGATYHVTGDLNWGSIHPMRRYAVERKGATAPK
jgi:hypothetical protein